MHILNFFSIWIYFVVTLLFAVLSFEGGYQVGLALLKRVKSKPLPPYEALLPAMLGLLAFLMAFTFSFAAARFDSRRALVVDEANAIGTTYLRAGYLRQPYQDKVRSLLKEYVKLLLDVVQTNKYEEGIVEANKC